MFPLRDENPSHHTPLVTYALVALNALAWVTLQGLGQERQLATSVCTLGLIPGELLGTAPVGTSVPIGAGLSCKLGQPNWLTPLTSMFMHGGWMHIIGNMWFLIIFGDNVEDALGHARFLLFYVACGLAAAAAQVFANPASAIPMVGASGAIGGVMGAYAVMYPYARIDVLLVLGVFVRVIPVSALMMLGYWFVIQLVSGSLSNLEAGVAFWAHVGGFAAGALLALPFRNRGVRHQTAIL
ncbi:MAG TPA: rhomboid family intramembrane serine protease [Myxococcota bacterium]|nr:rhomboid family intramembrane serine protease [Myxococcota bacterium]